MITRKDVDSTMKILLKNNNLSCEETIDLKGNKRMVVRYKSGGVYCVIPFTEDIENIKEATVGDMIKLDEEEGSP